LFRRAVAAWLAGDRHGQLQADLEGRLVLEQQTRRYADVLLVDPQARILLSATEDPDPVGPATAQVVQAALAGSSPVLGDFYRCPLGRIHLDAAASIPDDQGQPLAVVVLRTDAHDYLYPLIGSWPTASRSAETLLIERDGEQVIYLNELRHQTGTALSLRFPLSRTELPAVQAVLGHEGICTGIDYRGVSVLADLSPIPGTPWFIVAKVDQDEILAEARYRAGVTMSVVTLAILLVGALTAWVYRQRQAQLYQGLYDASRARHQAEEEFRATLYSIGDAVITTDTQGYVRHLNRVAETLTGWPESEARGRPLPEVFHIVHEQTRAAVESPVTQVLRDGTVVGLANHTLLVARDGREYPIADSGAPILDPHGQVAGVVLTFRDQTEERQAAAEVRRQKDLLATVVNSLPDYIYAKDRDSRFILANQALARDLGCSSPEELSGRTDRDYFPTTMAAGFLADEEGVLRTGEALVNREEEVQTLGGGTRHILSTKIPLRDGSGAVTGLVGVGRDITQLRQTEKLQWALHRVRDAVLQMQAEVDWGKVAASVHAELRLLLDFVDCTVCQVDPAAPATVFYRGFPDGHSDILHYPSLFPAIQQALDTGQPVLRRTRGEMAQYGDGITKPAIHSVVDVPFTHGTLAINSTEEDAFGESALHLLEQFALILSEAHRRLEDLRQLAAKEAQLRQAQKMEAIGRLAGGVAHDFNNLLTVIQGNCQLLQRRLAPDDPRCAEIEEISFAGDRATGLVRQLLAFSRRQAWQPRVLDLNRLIADWDRMLGRVIGEEIEVRFELEPELPPVLTDPGQLEQVLMNLVVNARDAMPKSGRLTVKTASFSLPHPLAVAGGLEAPPGEYVLLVVSDTGIGMDAATQARLFEPFFTTKEPGKGTGLGLATVYGIVQQSKGFLQVDSTPGEGSTFRIYLPRSGGEAKPASTPEPALKPPGGDETILVVEDDASVRGLVTQVLQAAGYTVLDAANGLEALQILDQCQGPVQLVVTDVVMPRMTGPELVAQITVHHPDTRVLYLSGYAEHATLPAVASVPLLQKPFDTDDLARLVRQLLDQPRAAGFDSAVY
jgi:PAS domain S-box-containing protein